MVHLASEDGSTNVLMGVTVHMAHAQGAQPSAVLFENVRIFNGTSDRLSVSSQVLVVGNIIKTISTAPIVVTSGWVEGIVWKRRPVR
jgi:hypothetical protein